ncbi:hypothetical protein FHR71_002061 [Methylobacterium sp. RAS18]|nr:hypothetical protein [Methylobacterium sp. RAS18]
MTKFEADANLGKARLFAGDRLWLIYSNYRTTIARANFLMGKSVDKAAVQSWQDDKNIRSMIQAVLPLDASAEVLSAQIGGLQTALAYMEAAFLKEASRVMSGSTSFAEMMSDVQATLSIASGRLKERPGETSAA